jgi:EAL domain-containing protein (putative c-di-GMP-specific phosphodiesterase class I)
VNSAGALIGVEALLRWNHPQRSVVSPRNFIPVAEDTGLILDIGRWVLVSACKQLAEWADVQCLTTLTMSVNVSARQFRHPDFVDEVKSALDFTGAESRLLRLELTESLLLEDVETVIDRMHALRALGVGFSLDDFGTGYSSLSYLKRLPLTELKIDMSFVRDVLVDPNDAAISRTIIALAHTMGLSVIAEGVESEAQRSFLERSGCDAYQGYLFGRPAPAAQIVQFAQALATGVSRPST